MARKRKLVLGKTHPLVLAAILSVVALSTVTLSVLQLRQQDARAKADALRIQAAILEEENREYCERIDSLGTLESAIRIAMEELGLVAPDTLVISPSN